MVDNSEFAVIFFVGSAYAFAIVLLYALARAWEKSLSPLGRPERTNQGGNQNSKAVELQSSASRSAVSETRKKLKSRGFHQQF